MTKPTGIADYNKYMGGVDCTDQLLKPYEIPCKTLKWYNKLAILYAAVCSQQLYCVSKGWWSKTIAALIFETGADMKIPREEHVIRLTECHCFWKQPLNKSLRRDAGCVGLQERSLQGQLLPLSKLSKQSRTLLLSMF